VITEGSGL